MKKKINIILSILILILAAILVYMLIERQGNSSEPIDNTTPVETSAPESTEGPHEHVCTETITTEATCTTNGLKTFTCECGDTYTEVIIATGHVFGEYIYNEDATYFTDGTTTAQCKKCEVTDTGTAFGSMLKYEITPMAVTMYAQQTVNVKNLPCTDGEKIGGLSINDEVWVTGQCIETGWYEICNDDIIIGYVSDAYLGTNKVNVSSSGGGNSTSQTYTFEAPNGDVITASVPLTWESVAPSEEGFEYTNNTSVRIYINGEYMNPGESRIKLMDGGDGGELVTDGHLNWN